MSEIHAFGRGACEKRTGNCPFSESDDVPYQYFTMEQSTKKSMAQCIFNALDDIRIIVVDDAAGLDPG